MWVSIGFVGLGSEIKTIPKGFISFRPRLAAQRAALGHGVNGVQPRSCCSGVNIPRCPPPWQLAGAADPVKFIFEFFASCNGGVVRE